MFISPRNISVDMKIVLWNWILHIVYGNAIVNSAVLKLVGVRWTSDSLRSFFSSGWASPTAVIALRTFLLILQVKRKNKHIWKVWACETLLLKDCHHAHGIACLRSGSGYSSGSCRSRWSCCSSASSSASWPSWGPCHKRINATIKSNAKMQMSTQLQ